MPSLCVQEKTGWKPVTPVMRAACDMLRSITIADLAGTLVVHRAALGDFVLIWPLLRSLAPCTVVTDTAKARLAERFLDGVKGVDIERPFWNRLWVEVGEGDRATIANDAVASPRITRVLSFVADANSVWAANARRAFLNAALEFHPMRPPTRVTDPRWQPALRRRPDGPIVFHVGAGSRVKRWPLQRSLELIADWRAVAILPIAGEVEREQFTPSERSAFQAVGGRYLTDLDALADLLCAASHFVGFDSGPTHLAAQLSVPTLALFGPTTPSVWSPQGPCVRTLAPAAPTGDMQWLAPPHVAAALRAMT